mmetsp:Transcript_86787/g.193207  ORF Transcript_86787/g.193207 Transcript_86787/m.193207 type:complete len:209 (-) Transcript_86787:66-692(-)
MWGLRSGWAGTNHFSQYAGHRSDFIVVRNPEFIHGRLGSERGVGHRWDDSKIPSHRARSAVSEQLAASRRRNEARLLAPREGGSGPTLKTRALTRCQSAPAVRGGRGANAGTGFERHKAGSPGAIRPSSAPAGAGAGGAAPRRSALESGRAPGPQSLAGATTFAPEARRPQEPRQKAPNPPLVGAFRSASLGRNIGVIQKPQTIELLW